MKQVSRISHHINFIYFLLVLFIIENNDFLQSPYNTRKKCIFYARFVHMYKIMISKVV